MPSTVFTNDDLILAAKVRDLAVSVRHGEATKELPALKKAAWEAVGAEPSRDDVKEFEQWRSRGEAAAAEAEAAWYKEHSLSLYIPRSLQFIEDVAAQIASLKAGS